MRKFVFLLTALTLLLLLPSCAERPDIEETEETETEEEYIKPPKDYLEQLAENLGYTDYPDSVWCYQPALVTEEDFVSIDKIKFDMSEPSPKRFISWNYMYHLELTHESSGGMWITEYPNSSFITTADGTRTKLCPYEECREDDGDTCAHISLAGGHVLGDWVYFEGGNECIAAPNHPNRSDVNGQVNMLMRYSISENRVEKLIDLPSYVSKIFSAYGVLYVEVTDPLSNVPYMLLVDSNGSVCRTKTLQNVGTFPANGKLYGVYNGELFCHTPALEEFATVTAASSVIGEYNGNLYLKRTDTGGKYAGILDDQSAYRESVVLLTPDGKETVLLDNIYAAKAAGGYLYTVMHQPAVHLFDIGGESGEKIFLNNDGKVLRYPLSNDGKIDGEGEVVFDTSLHCTESGEYIYQIDDFGDSVRVTTFFAPPLEDDWRCGQRMYVLTEDGAREDGEGMLSQY